jgi:hypothetical protein
VAFYYFKVPVAKPFEQFCAAFPYAVGMLVLILLWVLFRCATGDWDIFEAVRGKDQRWSTSKCQLFLWTLVALFSYASVYAARLGAGKLVDANGSVKADIPANLLLAMGFSVTSAVAAKSITVSPSPTLRNSTHGRTNWRCRFRSILVCATSPASPFYD